MPPTEGSICVADHGNAGQCVWHDGKWTREDGLKPCPYDQSN
jgi:hypothetical protein